MLQLGSIVRLRRRLVTNRLTDLTPRRRFLALAMLVGAAVVVVVGGHLAAPTLMEPPIDLATPRGLSPGDLPAGAAALEASFWLTALLASVLNFRVLELLFRRADIVAMQPLPIEPPALFFDRLLAAGIEAVVAATGASLFFIPLVWHGGTAAALASVAMLYGGLFFGTAISVVVMVLATQKLIPDDGSESTRPSLADSYGGPGQLLLYAPAVALSGVVVIALFWKLLVGEPLRLGYFSEPFWIGAAIILATTVGCLAVAYRAFVEDYYAMAPRFHEVDAADFSAVIDYQKSSFDTTKLWEWGLAKRPGRTVRALLLDDDRRMAGSRVGYAVVLILSIVGLWTIELDALPLWAAALVPAILTAAIVNPWHRLSRRVQHLDIPMGLPVSGVDLHAAVDRLTIREFLFIGAPYALAVGIILGYFRGLAIEGYWVGICALFIGFGIAGVVSIIRRLSAGPVAARWVPVMALIAFGALAITSLSIAFGVGLAAAVIAVVLSTIVRRRHAIA